MPQFLRIQDVHDKDFKRVFTKVMQKTETTKPCKKKYWGEPIFSARKLELICIIWFNFLIDVNQFFYLKNKTAKAFKVSNTVISLTTYILHTSLVPRNL